jgi:hypothetical protein
MNKVSLINGSTVITKGLFILDVKEGSTLTKKIIRSNLISHASILEAISFSFSDSKSSNALGEFQDGVFLKRIVW